MTADRVEEATPVGPPTRKKTREGIEILSPREYQVMSLLAAGWTNGETALALGCVQKTVDTHRGAALRKLKLRNNSDLTRFALANGVIGVHDEEALNLDVPPRILSTREWEITVRLSCGATNREIADGLSISVKTVDTHRGHALKKLGLRNNSDLTRAAIAHGMIDASGNVLKGQKPTEAAPIQA